MYVKFYALAMCVPSGMDGGDDFNLETMVFFILKHGLSCLVLSGFICNGTLITVVCLIESSLCELNLKLIWFYFYTSLCVILVSNVGVSNSWCV